MSNPSKWQPGNDPINWDDMDIRKAQSTSYNYDMFQDPEVWSIVKQLQDTPFWDEVQGASNRYFNYQTSLGDNLSYSLFGRSNANKYYEENRQALLNYLNSTLQKQTSLKVNDPSVQVAKDRMAGLNSDVSGSVTGTAQVKDVDNPADPMSERSGSADVAGQIFQPITTAISAISSVFSTGMSFAEFFMNMSGKQIANDQLKFNTASNIFDFVRGFADTLVRPGQTYDSVMSNYKGLSDKELGQKLIEDLGISLPRRMYPQLGKQLSSYLHSSEYAQKFVKTKSSEADALSDLGQKMSSQFFTGMSGDVSQSMLDAAKPFARLQKIRDEVAIATEEYNLKKAQVDKQEQENKAQYLSDVDPSARAAAENAQNQYNAGYFGALDGATMAGYEMRSKASEALDREAEASMKNFRNNLQKTMDQIVKDLQLEADKGNVFAKGCLIGLYTGDSKTALISGLGGMLLTDEDAQSSLFDFIGDTMPITAGLKRYYNLRARKAASGGGSGGSR